MKTTNKDLKIIKAQVHGIPTSVSFDVVEFLWANQVRTGFSRTNSYFIPRIDITFSSKNDIYQRTYVGMKEVRECLDQLRNDREIYNNFMGGGSV